MIYSVLPEVLSDVPVPVRRGGGPLTFGMVGRIAPWKGQDVFLGAFAHAFGQGDERAVIVGGALFGEDDCARELSRLADALGVGNRVEFRGHRPNVWDELSRIDVLVHASVTPEPFGQVIIEGMAAGVPVIAAQPATRRDPQPRRDRDPVRARQRGRAGRCDVADAGPRAPRG